MRGALVSVLDAFCFGDVFPAADPAGAAGISDGLAEQSAQGCAAHR